MRLVSHHTDAPAVACGNLACCDIHHVPGFATGTLRSNAQTRTRAQPCRRRGPPFVPDADSNGSVLTDLTGAVQGRFFMVHAGGAWLNDAADLGAV